MKTIDYSLDAEKNGGRITALSYTHSLSDLVGSWSATAAGGTFKAGNSISFSNVMKNGIISRAYKDSEGLWHIEGKDAGFRLMKSTPDISDLPEGNAKNVIQHIADFCDISLSMNTDGLSDFSVRSIISGSTCAEAILELALVSGLIAYINHNGVLVVEKSSTATPTFENVIDDSASDMDLDGYATQVLVTVNYRKKTRSEDSSSEVIIIGSTPSSKPDRETVSGLFRNGHYSLTKLEPFGVVEESSVSFTEGDITIKTEEKHTYDYKHKTVWRDNQEYLLFAFIETGYTLTRTTEGLGFSEITTETMSRTISGQDAVIDIPDDWKGDINFVEAETITRSTVRQGGKKPEDNMLPYSPEFDSKISREFSQKNKGKDLLCKELEETYEARQVGKISRVFSVQDNVKTPVTLPDTNAYLAIQAHSIPEWVLVKTYSTYYERHDADGNCLLSTQSQYSDDGSEWLEANALYDTGDEDLNDYEKDYAKFSQSSSGLNVSFNSSGKFANWSFIELTGRMKVTRDDLEGIVLADIDSWYDNGQYIRSSVCPHYNSSTKSCNIYKLDETSDTDCLKYKGLNWGYCSRAITALAYAREQEASQVEAPVIGSASLKSSSSKSPSVGYQRDIYIDDELDNAEKAQSIAETIAKNILAIKGSKGFRKTVTIPYNTSYQPNGIIVAVSHDWENLQTSVTYREEGDIPDFLISQNVASIAAFVSERENARVNIPKYGVVLGINEADNSLVSVSIGSSRVSCSTKLKNLAQNDIVLVSFPAGNKLRGQVITRL